MLFPTPQNGELTLRKFGDSKLLITYRSAGVTAAASGALSRSPGERRAVAAEPACCEAAVPAHERVISAYYILT